MSGFDPALVATEFASEDRLIRRRLDHWAIFSRFEGDPRDVELLALLERRPARVLDAGCGTGELAERIARTLDCEVVGLDRSERMVELTRERGLRAEVGELERLPFGGGEFDAAVANWVLYFPPDLDRCLAELARVLRPGGRLCAITNGERHLEEIWGVDPTTFSRESGMEPLERHFARVERRDVAGEVVFASRAALRGYFDAYDVLGRPPGSPDELDVPLRATCRWSVFVADTAS